MIFNYSKYECPDGNSIYRSSVPVVIKNGRKLILVEAIIDSGADYTIFPIEIAGILDIELNPKTKKSFEGAGGNSFTVYPSLIKIEHLLRQDGFRPFRWKTSVFFAESQPAILLGQNGFLNNFKVTLDGINKKTEIT